MSGNCVFLMPAPVRQRFAPFAQAVAIIVILYGSAAGAWVVMNDAQTDLSEEQGMENIIELAAIETQAQSQEQIASAASQLERERRAPAKTREDPVEKESPATPEEDLRMAQQTLQPLNEQPTETAQAAPMEDRQRQATAAPASQASYAAENQTGKSEAEKAAAPEHGNSQEASRRSEEWRRALFGHIGKFKKYPQEARGRNLKGEALVTFALDGKGHVSNIRIARSSGAVELDKAAMETLARADPMPPPPLLKGEAIELSLPMRFTLR